MTHRDVECNYIMVMRIGVGVIVGIWLIYGAWLFGDRIFHKQLERHVKSECLK